MGGLIKTPNAVAISDTETTTELDVYVAITALLLKQATVNLVDHRSFFFFKKNPQTSVQDYTACVNI